MIIYNRRSRNCYSALFIVIAFVSNSFAGTWLAGDLHCHSTHSNDADAKVNELIAEAKKKGLNFLAITDHDNHFCNTNSETVPTWHDKDFKSTDELILLHGAEWTSAKGHANTFSAKPYIYSEIWKANRNNDPVGAQDAVKAQGGIFSINHPVSHSLIKENPWEMVVPDGLVCMEIWNNTVSILNFDALSFEDRNFKNAFGFWDKQLLTGKRIACVGGSDTHHLHHLIYSRYEKLGGPTTWVYVEEKSQQGIINAIKKGHTTVSYSANDVRAFLTADADGNGEFETMSGDNITVPINTSVQFSVNLYNIGNGGEKIELSDDQVKPINTRLLESKYEDAFSSIKSFCETGKFIVLIVRNGLILKAWKVNNLSQWSFPVSIEGGRKDYYRVEVYGKTSKGKEFRTAVSNPIYCNFKPIDQVAVLKDKMSVNVNKNVHVKKNKSEMHIDILLDGIQKVMLFNIQGRQIGMWTSHSVQHEGINVGKLPYGIYYIKIKADNAVYSYPIHMGR